MSAHAPWVLIATCSAWFAIHGLIGAWRGRLWSHRRAAPPREYTGRSARLLGTANFLLGAGGTGFALLVLFRRDAAQRLARDPRAFLVMGAGLAGYFVAHLVANRPFMWTGRRPN